MKKFIESVCVSEYEIGYMEINNFGFCHLHCSGRGDIWRGNPCCVFPDLVSVFVPSKTNSELKRDDFSVFPICSYSCHKKSTLSKR